MASPCYGSIPDRPDLQGRPTDPTVPPLFQREASMLRITRLVTLLGLAALAGASAHAFWGPAEFAPFAMDAAVASAVLTQLPMQIHVALFDNSTTAETEEDSEEQDEREDSSEEEEGEEKPQHLKKVGMTISWATKQRTRTSQVRFGQTQTALDRVVSAASACEQYKFCDYSSPCMHHVSIDGEQLLPGTTYYYQCGDDDAGWSPVQSFVTVLPVGSNAPMSFGLIGDLGQTENSELTLRHLSSRNDLSAVIHAGDLAYADSEQPRWDRWGRLVEPLASRLPWMVAAGNHEVEHPCQAEVSPFVAYQVRFRMPYDRSDRLQRRNMYYAFRTGLSHFITLSPYVATDTASLQYQWLEQELDRVDRSVTPWIVVIMHGPWYNSNTAHQGHEPQHDMKKAMEELLFTHHVDLVLAGHVHAYERSHPVYKEQVRPDGITYVVVGDGGNREGLADRYISPSPAWSAYRKANYGFAVLHVENSTHALMEWYKDQPDGEATVHDGTWLTSTQFRMQQQSAEDSAPQWMDELEQVELSD